MNAEINRAIFISEAFKNAQPQAYDTLYQQFRQDVGRDKARSPLSKYHFVNWLLEKKNPLFIQFAQTQITTR